MAIRQMRDGLTAIEKAAANISRANEWLQEAARLVPAYASELHEEIGRNRSLLLAIDVNISALRRSIEMHKGDVPKVVDK